MNLIENWGSGVKRYIREVKESGLSEPEFIVWPNAVRVNVFRRRPGEGNEGDVGNFEGNEGNYEGNERSHEGDFKDRMMKEIRANPRLTIAQLQNLLGCSHATVERCQKELVNAGVICRVGGTRGYWKVK